MSGVILTTRCEICGQEFEHEQFKSMIESKPQAAFKVMEALARHISESKDKRHQEAEMRASLAANSLLGLLRMQHFTSQDTSAMQIRDVQRFQLMEMVRKNHCPDEKIVQQVTALGLPDEFVQRVITCVRLMRDIIEERGQFQPKLPVSLDTNPASKSALLT